ncbi:MAG: quinolinate synthase NadA [Bdellovibrionaceae bacterium]|jgi:quinolinate synthase|nr:quinolinate synthase NadA [Pseudobdellovibrionaceae bacterium]
MRIQEEILRLKKQRNAVILAHYYEDGAIQDIADYVGDSLHLAQVGRDSQAPVLLLAGVYFMAESVKVLAPHKTVLVPDAQAGCSLVEASPYDAYLKWRKEHPTGLAMTYINSSAAVKSISDVICTSSNAEKIVKAMPKDRPILFGPDKNLGGYLAKKLNREMIMWDGACEVHILFSAKKLFQLKQSHPEAKVLAHPECEPAVLQFADVVGSTSKLLSEVNDQSFTKFIVATEPGIFHQMQKQRPEAEFILAPGKEGCGCQDCPYMKLNTLEKIKSALENLSPVVELKRDDLLKAYVPLKRMMDITDDRPVFWPDEFVDHPKDISVSN